MGFSDVIKKSVLQGFSSGGISTSNMIFTLGICFLISAYIYFVYRWVTRSTFYDRNFNVSMSVISVIVAGIILAMQSNLIISLGMVGALSIVRFRTAIKEPMDLLFLFWSIGNGIMCGAGLYRLTLLVALATTFGLLVLQVVPLKTCPYLVIVNAKDKTKEGEILRIVEKYSKRYRIDSKNIRAQSLDMIIEIHTKEAGSLVDELSEVESVTGASLLYHDAPVKS